MRKVIAPYLFFVLPFISIANISFAQLPNIPAIQWQKCIGGSKNDVANDVLLNADGTMVVVGLSNSNDGDVSEHHGTLDSADAWVAKLDTSGKVLWQRSIGGINKDEFRTVIASGDGNYLCIGYTNSVDGDIIFNNGNSDFLVVKISKDGNIIWTKTYGGTLEDQAYNGILASDGTYIIVGTTFSYDGDVQSKGFGRTGADAWIIKLDAAGNILWENSSGDTTVMRAVGIFESTDQNYMVCTEGVYYYTDPGESLVSADNGKIYKVDKNSGSFSLVGNTLIGQGQAFEYSHSGDGYSFCKRNNGFIISYNDYNSSTTTNCWSTGVIINNVIDNVATGYSEIVTPQNCDYNYTSSGISAMHGITALSDSSFIGAGWYTDPSTLYYDDAYFLAGKFPSSSSSNHFGGSGIDAFNSIKYFPDQNEFIAVGYTNSNDGDVSGNHNGGQQYGLYDCWVVKLINSDMITGHVFLDKNNNGIQDAGEPGFDDAKIQSTSNGVSQYAIPNRGVYTNIASLGTFNTTISINKPYYTTTSPGKTSVFTSYGRTDTVNFPVHPIPGIKDYTVMVTALEPAKPNRDVEYVLTYSNKGTDTLTNRTLYFIKDIRTSFGYSVPLPTKISGDTLFWTVTGITPDSSASIKFYIKMDPIPLLNIKDTLTNAVYIDSTGDANTSDNSFLLRQIVVGSFDPNDKLESHGGFITPDEMIAEKNLCYTIRFQNNGNEVASSIIVRDTLDKKLDGSSIEIAACSHPYQFNIQNGRYLTWTFNNINLPDSITSDSLSKGYITYKIMPMPGFKTGDTIRNTASIYFDFNPPLATNTQLTIFTAEKDTWTGANSTAWENPLNWSTGKVPDAGVDVYINNGMANYPVLNSNASCRSININPGATITVNTGYKMNVGGIFL